MCALMNLYIRYHYWLSFILNECTDCFNKVFFPTATTQLILEVSRKIAAELSSQCSVQYIMFFFDLLFSRVISCKSWHCVLKERWCEHVFVRECSCIHVWVWESVCVCVCVCVDAHTYCEWNVCKVWRIVQLVILVNVHHTLNNKYLFISSSTLPLLVCVCVWMGLVYHDKDCFLSFPQVYLSYKVIYTSYNSRHA